ncbi:MAG: hypothetical protein M3301_00930, partial [Chloroflexota bacterium]|nr:hypothetical protein [Chloroflexota bacterium]
LEYCSEETAYFVPADEVPVPDAVLPPELPMARPPTWYEPDRRVVRQLMRQVYEDRQPARRKGARASVYVRAEYTWRATATAMLACMEQMRCPAATSR